MATSLNFMEYIYEILQELPVMIHYRRMFGEYCLYANGKPIGLICDDIVYLKPFPLPNIDTSDIVMAPPFPGAKGYYKIDIDNIDRFRAMVVALEPLASLPRERKKKAKNIKK